MVRILFFCPSNGARSQLAEGIARQMLGVGHEVRSAGRSASHVSLLAVRALKETGIDISTQTSKTLNELPHTFLEKLNWVISLSDEGLDFEKISHAQHIVWPLVDPSEKRSSVEEQLQRFREVRDSLASRLEEFILEVKSRQIE